MKLKLVVDDFYDFGIYCINIFKFKLGLAKRRGGKTNKNQF